MAEPSTLYGGVAHSDGELKRRSVRGNMVAMCGQGAKVLLQIVTTMSLARLLTAEDFGLLGMATVSPRDSDANWRVV
jgi:hypothetical protein